MTTLRNNGKSSGENLVKDHLAGQWRERLERGGAGRRWLGPRAESAPVHHPRAKAKAAVPEAAPEPPKTASPLEYGRVLWETLNWSLANAGDLDLWKAILTAIQRFLESPAVGCEECCLHFAEFLAENPLPETVADARAWTHRAHNHASKHAKKRLLPNLDEIARKFLWN